MIHLPVISLARLVLEFSEDVAHELEDQERELAVLDHEEPDEE
jgi:hypothetical protein